MRNYETVFILDPTLGDERTAQEIERAKSLIESAKGEVVDIQRWGKRKLAYEIKRRREGIYTVLKYRSDGNAVFELERNLRLSEQVLRFITVMEESTSTETRGERETAGTAGEASAGPDDSGQDVTSDDYESRRRAADGQSVDGAGDARDEDGGNEERSSG